jgi:hypothetical protein
MTMVVLFRSEAHQIQSSAVLDLGEVWMGGP